jgi:RNA recognition motif-containing protein
MGTRAEAQTAVEMFDGKALNERKLTVHIAKSSKKSARFRQKRGGRRRR